MPVKLNPIAVFDFETTGLDPTKIQPIEIACQVYNSRSLELIPGAIFNEYCKPTKDCKIDPKVFEITKIDPLVIENAPSIEIIFPKFIEFVNQYNVEKNDWTSPIAAGQNINKYDLIIVREMLKKFGKKGESTTLFNPIRSIDLMDISWLWFENTKELESFSLDNIRRFMGIKTSGTHRALKDVEDVGQIIMRFIKLHRALAEEYMPQFKDAFKKGDVPASKPPNRRRNEN